MPVMVKAKHYYVTMINSKGTFVAAGAPLRRPFTMGALRDGASTGAIFFNKVIPTSPTNRFLASVTRCSPPVEGLRYRQK